ncbi:inactive polyglycylase TTLL10 isoform 1-T1 [Vipera latastei]
MSRLDERRNEEVPGSGPFFYIGGANGVDTLNNYCKSKGWQRIYDNRREDYVLKWCETKFRDTYCNFREGEQLLYQIPNNKILTTKIGLLMNLREYDRVMKKVGQTARLLKMEDFFPETFRLDAKDEREIFFEMYKEPQIWICKPTSSNQGRGIFLLKSQAEVRSLQAKLQVTEDETGGYKKLPYKLPQARIVQRYIDRPLLLEGKKFDVRSYLLIACTVPYMVFFGHGYVRLTCLNYDPKSDDLTSHLTNQYVQKKSPIYTHVKEETVWLMDRFNNYVNEKFRQAKGLPRDWVYNSFTKRMKEIMLQCFLSVKSKLECKLGFFDLIGCDFLIDEDFKVWLLEMNANPALHTNCTALRSVIPTVVNETLNLTVEIFTKAQKTQSLLPLESLCHFSLLYNGTASNNGLPQPARSKISLCSLKAPRASLEKAGGGGNNPGVPNPPPDKQPPPKVPEKAPKADSRGDSKGDPTGPPEGLAAPPGKGVRRDPLPMPQIQISIIPSLTCCPSVKAILRGHQVCTSGNQYIIKPVPAVPDKAEGAEDQAKALNLPRGNSKDKSYATWFQQTFGTKLPPASDHSGGENALTSSQMLSLHLQSSLPPNSLLLPQFPKSFSPLAVPGKRPAPAESKAGAVAVTHSCRELLPQEKKISHRGS